MSKIQQSPEVDRVPDKEFKRYVAIFLQGVQETVNGNLDFVQNIRGQITNAQFTSAGQEIAIPHSLGRTPSGYLIFKKSADVNIYDGLTAWNSSNLYLRSSGASSVTVFIF